MKKVRTESQEHVNMLKHDRERAYYRNRIFQRSLKSNDKRNSFPVLNVSLLSWTTM